MFKPPAGHNPRSFNTRSTPFWVRVRGMILLNVPHSLMPYGITIVKPAIPQEGLLSTVCFIHF
jgi:hypothetical protein